MMSVINISSADTEWFNGPGWYIIFDEGTDIQGPYEDKVAAEIKEAIFVQTMLQKTNASNL